MRRVRAVQVAPFAALALSVPPAAALNDTLIGSVLLGSQLTPAASDEHVGESIDELHRTGVEAVSAQRHAAQDLGPPLLDDGGELLQDTIEEAGRPLVVDLDLYEARPSP